MLFIKVHKCASSTVSGIITRYGVKNNLTFALPRHDFGHINWPSLYRPESVWANERLKASGIKLDILSQHAVYDRCYVRQSFPKSDTIYVTILREPMAQLRSVLNYFIQFKPGMKSAGERRTAAFLENPKRWPQTWPIVYGHVRFGNVSLSRNLMAHDLGFPMSQYENDSAVELFVNRIAKDFSLVLIADYLYESLVLLRRMLCWSFRDMLFLTLNTNSRNNKVKNNKTPFVTDRMKETLQKWSSVDQALYQHFNRTLWQKIGQQNADFRDEVQALRDVIRAVRGFCRNVVGDAKTKTRTKPKSPLKVAALKWTEEFQVEESDCIWYRTMPHTLTPLLWRRMALRLIRAKET